MVKNDTLQSITKTIDKLKSGTIFTFEELFSAHKIKTTKDKFAYTKELLTALQEKISILPEDKDATIGLPWVVRYVKN